MTLNVSLHATTQDLRDKLMPGVSGMPLGQLHDELARYNERTGRQVVLGYLLLDGVVTNEAPRKNLHGGGPYPIL